MIQVKKTTWNAHKDAIQALRQTVFIEEQKVDRAEEFDGLDELDNTHHFAAFDENEKIIAYGRLLEAGKIGRMAVLAEHRNKKIGHALLREIALFALKHNTLNQEKKLFLHAQTRAQAFYERAGFIPKGEIFEEAGIAHISMEFTPKNEASIPALLKDAVLRFDDTNDIHFHLSLVSQCTSRHIDILSNNLQHPIFTETHLVNALSHAARRSRNSFIRILLRDSKKLHGTSHPLVALSQRLSSRLEIRALTEEPQKPDMAYLISDAQRMVYFNNEEEHIGFANYQAGPEAQTLLEEFNNLWNRHSKADPNLRRLSL